MIAAKSRAQLAVRSLESRRYDHGPQRESVADAFGAGNDVGANIEVLMGKKAAATPVAALYFITDEHGAALVAGTAQTLHELGGSQADAAHS